MEASDTICITEQTASTSPMYINGFSYGEIIIIFILILIFSLLFFDTIKKWVFPIKVVEYEKTKKIR